jgi:hypothetical protein
MLSHKIYSNNNILMSNDHLIWLNEDSEPWEGVDAAPPWRKETPIFIAKTLIYRSVFKKSSSQRSQNFSRWLHHCCRHIPLRTIPNMDNHFNCPICMERFGTAISDPLCPRILPCGHGLCTDCCSQIVVKRNGILR